MTSRLANRPIIIAHGSLTVRLWPSLRAGLQIAQAYTLDQIRDGIHESSFCIVSDLIDIATDYHEAGCEVVRARIQDDGFFALVDFIPALVEFVTISLGLNIADQGQPGDVDFDHPAPDFAKALASLFEIGTGWLGWTPEATWSATPAEISAAYSGFIAKFNAMNGTSDSDQPAGPSTLPSEDQVRADLASFRAKHGSTL